MRKNLIELLRHPIRALRPFAFVGTFTCGLACGESTSKTETFEIRGYWKFEHLADGKVYRGQLLISKRDADIEARFTPGAKDKVAPFAFNTVWDYHFDGSELRATVYRWRGTTDLENNKLRLTLSQDGNTLNGDFMGHSAKWTRMKPKADNIKVVGGTFGGINSKETQLEYQTILAGKGFAWLQVAGSELGFHKSGTLAGLYSIKENVQITAGTPELTLHEYGANGDGTKSLIGFSLAKNTLPGKKRFTIDGSEFAFDLEIPGHPLNGTPSTLRFVKQTGENEFEPVLDLGQGSLVWIEAKFDEPHVLESVPATLDWSGGTRTVSLTKVADKLFRGGPIKIAAPTEEQSQE